MRKGETGVMKEPARGALLFTLRSLAATSLLCSVNYRPDPMTTYCLEAVYARIVRSDTDGKLRGYILSNTPTQTTASPSHNAFAVSCRLFARVSSESAYIKEPGFLPQGRSACSWRAPNLCYLAAFYTTVSSRALAID